MIEGVSEMTASGGGAEISVTCQNISQTANCAKRVQVFDALLTICHGTTNLLLIRPS